MFELDPRLQKDTITVGDFPLCRLLLMNDSTYPWFILVPRRDESREIHHLAETDQAQLWKESSSLAGWMESTFKFDKMNVAALGNVVSQLHLHHVGRRVDDPTWPGPVWGKHPAEPYAVDEIEKIKQQAGRGLAEYLGEES